MILKNKNAIIYGAGSAIGGAVARAFAHEGARVFLTGRSLDSLEIVAEEITRHGGLVEVDVAYGIPSNKEFQSLAESKTSLKRLPNLAEVANTAAFIASDQASAITGTVINLSCGSIVD